MARLDAAIARFNAALDVLESGCDALANRTSDSAPQIDHSEEIATLKSEREQLLTRIAAFEEESQSLAGMAEAVETRLDGAITEIRAALGRG
jgi:chromosome segregation ATPase